MAWHEGGSHWEEMPMKNSLNGNEFAQLLEDVREEVRYYVDGDGVRSREFRLSVGKAVGVKSLDVTYHYPSWTGLPSHTERGVGDIKAVKGTRGGVTVHTL